MAMRSQPARRTTDRIESLAVWILLVHRAPASSRRRGGFMQAAR